jgi:hypothetical protein
MIIDIFGLPAELIKNKVKLLPAHLPRRPAMPVAKGTAHIADIGNLHIYFIVNFPHLRKFNDLNFQTPPDANIGKRKVMSLEL